MNMPKPIQELVKELELIGEDKITQPQGASRRTVLRAARIIKDLYSDSVQV